MRKWLRAITVPVKSVIAAWQIVLTYIILVGRKGFRREHLRLPSRKVAEIKFYSLYAIYKVARDTVNFMHAEVYGEAGWIFQIEYI